MFQIVHFDLNKQLQNHTVCSQNWINKRNTLILTKLEQPLKHKQTELQVKKKELLIRPLSLQVLIFIMKVYSYECPDLTLIDLPGITRISVGTQLDIEKVTIDMAKRYCA